MTIWDCIDKHPMGGAAYFATLAILALVAIAQFADAMRNR